MSTRNQNWYDLNSVRSYPLDDRATRTGDDGSRLRNDILVDANLRFPAHLGQYAHLSSLAVTPGLVTATFLACPDPLAAPDTFVPLAAVTARRPLARDRHVAVTPLYPGVGGWVVFGDTDEPFAARFSTPLQGLLLARCARPYRALPVESVRKLGVATPLTGIVALKGIGDVVVEAADRVVEGVSRKVVVVRLNSFSANRNVFDLYKGPCGKRPETGNCDKEGVQYINTVGPDCNGNVDLVFVGDTEVTPYDGSSEGIVLDHPLGLTEACTRDDRLPDREGRLPNEYDDLCTSEFEGQDPNDQDRNSLGEEPPVSDVPTVSSEVVACPELPYTETFDDADAEGWRVLHGQFGYTAGDSPQQPEQGRLVTVFGPAYTVYRWVPAGSSSSSAGFLSSSSLGTSSLVLEPNHVYRAESVERRNVSLWDTCAPAATLGKRVRADLRMIEGGPKLNAGVVLNYHTVGGFAVRDEYLVAEVNQPTDSVRLRLWGGTSFVTLGEVAGLGLKANDWYRIQVEITEGPDPETQVRLAVALDGITDPTVQATFVTVTTRFLPADGRFGFATDQSLAEFSYFFLEELP